MTIDRWADADSGYRGKGVVYCADVPERRIVMQVVGKRADLALEGPWGERTPRTRIVAIGALGCIDEDALRERFEQCITQPAHCDDGVQPHTS